MNDALQILLFHLSFFIHSLSIHFDHHEMNNHLVHFLNPKNSILNCYINYNSHHFDSTILAKTNPKNPVHKHKPINWSLITLIISDIILPILTFLTLVFTITLVSSGFAKRRVIVQLTKIIGLSKKAKQLISENDGFLDKSTNYNYESIIKQNILTHTFEDYLNNFYNENDWKSNLDHEKILNILDFLGIKTLLNIWRKQWKIIRKIRRIIMGIDYLIFNAKWNSRDISYLKYLKKRFFSHTFYWIYNLVTTSYKSVLTLKNSESFDFVKQVNSNTKYEFNDESLRLLVNLPDKYLNDDESAFIGDRPEFPKIILNKNLHFQKLRLLHRFYHTWRIQSQSKNSYGECSIAFNVNFKIRSRLKILTPLITYDDYRFGIHYNEDERSIFLKNMYDYFNDRYEQVYSSLNTSNNKNDDKIDRNFNEYKTYNEHISNSIFGIFDNLINEDYSTVLEKKFNIEIFIKLCTYYVQIYNFYYVIIKNAMPVDKKNSNYKNDNKNFDFINFLHILSLRDIEYNTKYRNLYSSYNLYGSKYQLGFFYEWIWRVHISWNELFKDLYKDLVLLYKDFD